MSRKFAVNDKITFAAGANATLQNGAHSVAYLIKPTNCRGGFYDARDAGDARRYGVNPFDNNIFVNTQVSGFQSFDYSSLFGIWGIAGWSKVNGNAAFRYHLYSYPGNAWTHADIVAQGTLPNGIGTSTQFHIGSFDAGQSYVGNIAVAGYWNGTVLSDGQYETLPSALLNWVALNPSVLLDFHNPVATPITDIMGSGANQSAIVGTTADADEPPGFSYALGGSPSYRLRTYRKQRMMGAHRVR